MADRDTSLTNELARERNREAADRTLLAWIRTSLAMISLGFAIERLGQVAFVMDGRLANFSPLKTRVFDPADRSCRDSRPAAAASTSTAQAGRHCRH